MLVTILMTIQVMESLSLGWCQEGAAIGLRAAGREPKGRHTCKGATITAHSCNGKNTIHSAGFNTEKLVVHIHNE